MTAATYPSAFSVNESPNEYEAIFTVTGEVRMEIEASSPEEAEEKALAMCQDEAFGLELDEVGDVDISRVRKKPPMYRVTRDGKAMQVSHLRDGDIPREPDERGF